MASGSGTSRPILEWAEKRAEALRRAQQLRSDQQNPGVQGRVAWRTPPIRGPRGHVVPKLMGSQSAQELLELSFRKTPAHGLGRPWSAGNTPAYEPQLVTGFSPGEAISEQALQGELVKTSQMLTAARRQLVEEREAAAEIVQEAKDEAAQAIRLLRERDGQAAATDAELQHLLYQKELAVGAERAKLANMLAQQRNALQVELERVKEESEARLEKQRQEHVAMEQETQALRHEVSKLEQQLESRVESTKQEAEARAAKTLEQQMEKEREGRVAQLHRMASRRIGKQALTKGFNAWADAWADRRRLRQNLQRAAARLGRPALAGAFLEWVWVRDEKVREIEMRSVHRFGHEEARRREELEKELEALRDSFQSSVKEQVDAAIKQYERERKEAERQEAEEAAKRREKAEDARVTNLHEQALRRIGQLGVARAFSSWAGSFLEHKHLKQLLQRAGARLQKPKLAGAFIEWWSVREETIQARMKAEMEAEREKLLQQLKEAQALAAQTEEEAVRKLAEKAMQDKHDRVEQLHRMASRRIASQGLTRGFNAWIDLWNETHRQRQLMQRAAARLGKPQMADAFFEWWAVYEEILLAKEEAEKHRLAEQLGLMEKEALEAAKLAEKRLAEQMGLMEKEAREAAELAEKRLAEQAEAERQGRIEHLQRMASRRMAAQGISRGFNAWFDMWYEERRNQNLLRRAAGRLSKPHLSAAFSDWWTDWEQARSHEESAARPKDSQNLFGARAEVRKLERQVEKVRLEYEEKLAAERKAALRTEQSLQERLDKLNGKVQEATESARLEAQEAERADRVEQLHRMAIRRMSLQGLSRGFNGWLEGHLDQARLKRVLTRAAARMHLPKLAGAFMEWLAVLDEEARARALAAAEARASEEAKKRAENETVHHAQRLQLEDAIERAKTEFEKNLRKQQAAQQEEMKRVRGELEAALAQERLQLDKERQVHRRELESHGIISDAQANALLQEQMQKEREERVAQLHRMASRRIAAQDLSRSFNAWQAEWFERRRAQSLLQHAAARFTRPTLAKAFYEWHAVCDEARQDAHERSQKCKLESAEGELAATKLKLEQVRTEEQNAARDELDRVRASYEAMLEAEGKKREQLNEELKSMLQGGEEALKAATARVRQVNAIEEQVKGELDHKREEAKKSQEDLERAMHQLALERTALVDERKAHEKLRQEFELLRGKHNERVAADDRAKKEGVLAGVVADKEAESTKKLMLRLKIQEEALKRESEKRLAFLLAEQRTSFEQTMRTLRTDSEQQSKGFTNRITELEAALKAAQAAYETTRLQLLKLEPASTRPVTTAPEVGGGLKSAELMRAAVTKIGRQPTTGTRPLMYSELRILARKSREEAAQMSRNLSSGESNFGRLFSGQSSPKGSISETSFSASRPAGQSPTPPPRPSRDISPGLPE